MANSNAPNILYLHAHDAGRYVQPYGFPCETPNLMRFAREGVLFRKAFCTAPTCGPSRASLLCGQYPHQLGMFGLPGPQGWCIDELDKHLVRQLNAWGYETVLAGVQHEVDHADISPLNYARILEKNGTHPPREQGQFYPETIDMVEAYLAQHDGKKPFFLSVGIDEPHRDNIARPELKLEGDSKRFSKTRYYDPEKLDWRYTAPPPWLPDLPEIRRDMESYREGVQLMDEYMGRVLYALKQHSLEENTLVIITTDHGIEFPGGKKTLSDQGLQVMLILRGPGGFEGGRIIEPMVSQLDIYPTLCELLKHDAPHTLEGKSLLPLVRGEIEAQYDYLYAEQTYHGSLEPLRSVRTERYKYIRSHLEAGPHMRHDGPTTDMMEEIGWYERQESRESLFDLYLDPWEACNRVNDPNCATILADLRQRLDQWMHESGDCFPSGDFPAPPAESSL